MPPVRGISQKNIVSFNSGEWSPLLDSRVDQKRYDSASRILTNFKISPYGPIDRRPGLQFIELTKFPNKKSRLIGYQFSVTTSFILELGDKYMRFYSNGVRVETSPGVAFEIVTPWLEAEIFQVQFVQINDLVYLAHPNRHPQKLQRITDTNWSIQDVPFQETAFMDINITTTTLTSSVTTGSGVLTSSAPVFDVGHVGGFWKLTHPRASSSLTLSLAVTGTSGSLATEGIWNLRTTGTWEGTLRLKEFNTATGVFDNVRELTSKNDSNFDIEDDQPIERLFRLDYTSISGSGEAYLELTNTTSSGIVRVDSFNSPTSVNITVIDNLESTAVTDLWREGAWNTFRGFPRAVTIFEQRITYAGTQAQPQTIWASKIADYEDFELGTNDDDSFQYTIASTEQNIIQWLQGQSKLLIGTAGSEWTMGGDGGKPVTPSNVGIFRQSTYGSKHIQAVMVNDVVLYVQRNGRKVREMVESETSVVEKYIANDLTILSEHITEGEIIQADYSQQPDSVYHAINGEGDLLPMTYERDQEVVGWGRYQTPGAGGKFESVAIVYGDTGDEIWVSVKRTIGGTDIRYIERMNPFDWQIKEDAFYVDSGITVVLPTHSSGDLTAGKSYRVIDNSGGMDLTAVGGPAAPTVFQTFDATITATPNYGTGSVREVSNTFTGLLHLAGETVNALGDGAVFQNLTVSATGTISLPKGDKVTKIHMGLKYESVVKPMRLEADARIGSFLETEVKLRKIIIRVVDSLGVTYSTNVEDPADNTKFEEIQFPFRDTRDLMDESPPLFTGSKTIPVQSRHTFDPELVIKQTQPLPMTLLSLIQKYEVTGQ